MAETRDKQSQGTQRSLSFAGGGGSGGAYQLNYNNPNFGAGIVTGTGADWFGPLNPMNPIAPVEVKGRVHDYPSGYNLQIRPRSYSGVSFEQLRNFADFYDILRLVIETRKDQMGRRRWNVVSRDTKLRKNVTPEMQNRIAAIENFFLRPDGKHFWNEWLRMLLEDLLVLDAPTIYKQKTFGGHLYRLVPLDGSTIKRVIDDWAETPDPPHPAYQQVLKGYPAVDYTTDEIMYRPRNLRTHKIYGFGPVEQIIMTINIAMRREIWQLESFTEGNIPEALIGTPDNWTPDQIRSFQEWFDSVLEGQTNERRRAKFVPGEIAKGYVATKPAELFGVADEWLARVVCFAFSVSPQPFIKMMNRATAESAQEVAAEEGLAPLEAWVKGMMDELIIDEFNSPDLEFEFLDENELDPKIKSDIVTTELSKSLLTLNEARGEMGLDPIPDCPEADRPMVLLPTGWVPFALTEEEKNKQAEDAANAAADSHAKQLELTQAKAKGGTDEEDSPPGNGGSDTVSGAAGSTSGSGVAEKSDLPFPLPQSPGDQSCGCEHRVLQKRDGGTGSELDPLRPSIAKIEKKLKAATAAVLVLQGRSVAKQVTKYLAGKGSKAKKVDEDERRRMLQDKVDASDDWSDINLDELIDSLDLSILEGFDDNVAGFLESAYLDAAKVSVSQIGAMANIEDQIIESMVNKVNDRAVEWARENAADLLSVDGDESIVNTTREMVRSSIADGMDQNLSRFEIGDQLEESYGFSEDRAQLIAATEITSANSMGALSGYEEAQDAGVSVQKSWLVLEDGCPICQENADAGEIDLDEEFPSGDMAPGAHPNCRCVLVPVVNGEEDDSADVGGDNMEQADKPDFTKRDNRNNMSEYFEVDTAARSPIWAMGGNTDEATAERESSLLQGVDFDRCIATQDYCDFDKVQLYMDDPTAKGFAPMAYYDGSDYYIQDGHHRAVASKLSGNGSMSMNVKNIEPPVESNTSS